MTSVSSISFAFQTLQYKQMITFGCTLFPSSNLLALLLCKVLQSILINCEKHFVLLLSMVAWSGWLSSTITIIDIAGSQKGDGGEVIEMKKVIDNTCVQPAWSYYHLGKHLALVVPVLRWVRVYWTWREYADRCTPKSLKVCTFRVTSYQQPLGVSMTAAINWRCFGKSKRVEHFKVIFIMNTLFWLISGLLIPLKHNIWQL